MSPGRIELAFRIHEYDGSYNQFIGQAMIGFVKVDELTGPVRRRRSKHWGPNRNVIKGIPLDHEKASVAFKAPMDHDQVLNCSVDAHVQFLAELGQSHLDGLKAVLLMHVGGVCDAAGTSKDAGGAPISHELILDMIERIEIDFDEMGEPTMGVLVASPDIFRKLLELPQTDEHLQRFRAIIATKKNLWIANQKTRRLKADERI